MEARAECAAVRRRLDPRAEWDGFRCSPSSTTRTSSLQSKSGQPLARYFPEIVAALAALPPAHLVLDGEIVITRDGHLEFDDLLQRIHPAASRIQRLAKDTPATLLAFDLLLNARGTSLVSTPLVDRRRELEALFATLPASTFLQLSPATTSRPLAEQWMRELGTGGLDGVVAKRLSMPYRSGERDGMVKVKRLRTVDCVVGGFRYAQKGGAVGSLLLGVYNKEGLLDHVGFTSSFTEGERRTLEPILAPHKGGTGFTGRAPGGPSRWSTERSAEWEPLEPTLVCEVRYDHFSGGRFRHGTKFLRWRPDKAPRQCTRDQIT